MCADFGGGSRRVKKQKPLLCRGFLQMELAGRLSNPGFLKKLRDLL
jgi:hypothetical protein